MSNPKNPTADDIVEAIGGLFGIVLGLVMCYYLFF
jgi:hypothetical protein